jgi:lysophospholipase L1-like esterase
MYQVKIALGHVAVTLAFLTGLVSLAPAAAAATPPKVVFLGDFATYYWTSGFAANPNWINKGELGFAFWGGTAGSIADRFQTDVVSLHPQIVHIMMGASDAQLVDDATFRFGPGGPAGYLAQMITEAKAANIKVIVGIEPQDFTEGNLAPMNAAMIAVAQANGVPVINYGNVLCGCVAPLGGSTGFDFATGASYLEPTPVPNPTPPLETGGTIPSPAGYAVMTQMAEAVINTMGAKLEGGYLQNAQQFNSNIANNNAPGGPSNVNTVAPNAVVQFTPYGYYSNGMLVPFLNSTFEGSSGTWVSSNPEVLYVNQMGLMWALNPGTASITYTSPTGVKFNRWVMYVPDPN